jgi:cell division protein FtsI/penicillin-binding protein 2
MGGGEVNEKARLLWHNYLVDHYNFGKQTGIEQSGEGTGIIPDPKEGYGLNVQYAETTFGQGMSVTLMQYAAALSSVINGGTYYKPSLVQSMTTPDGVTHLNEKKIVTTNVVSANTSAAIVSLMEQYAKENNSETARAGFSIGGKTGTAEIASPEGGYYKDKFNGTYAGFLGGRTPQYVIVIRIDEPKISGSAGAIAARPIFTEIANNMMDSLPFSRGL